jgi:hypothetical protein
VLPDHLTEKASESLDPVQILSNSFEDNDLKRVETFFRRIFFSVATLKTKALHLRKNSGADDVKIITAVIYGFS